MAVAECFGSGGTGRRIGQHDTRTHLRARTSTFYGCDAEAYVFSGSIRLFLMKTNHPAIAAIKMPAAMAAIVS